MHSLLKKNEPNCCCCQCRTDLSGWIHENGRADCLPAIQAEAKEGHTLSNLESCAPIPILWDLSIYTKSLFLQLAEQEGASDKVGKRKSQTRDSRPYTDVKPNNRPGLVYCLIFPLLRAFSNLAKQRNAKWVHANPRGAQPASESTCWMKVHAMPIHRAQEHHITAMQNRPKFEQQKAASNQEERKAARAQAQPWPSKGNLSCDAYKWESSNF